MKREKDNQKMRDDIGTRQLNLKILFAIIRSPMLCDMFHKEERKRFETEQIEKRLQESIHILRQYNFDEGNAEPFVSNLH